MTAALCLAAAAVVFAVLAVRVRKAIDRVAFVDPPDLDEPWQQLADQPDEITRGYELTDLALWELEMMEIDS